VPRVEAPRYPRGPRGILLTLLRWIVQWCAIAALAAWLIGCVLTDRTEWSQWLWWIPSAAAVAAGLVLTLAGVPFTKRLHPVVRSAVRLSPLVLASIWFTAVDHRLMHAPPENPEGLSILHWTIGVPMRDGGAAAARRIIELDPDLAILTDGSTAATHPDILAWLGDNRRPRRTGPFTVLTKRPVRQLRTLARGDGIAVSLLVLEAAETGADPLTILLIDLPSDPTLSRRDVTARLMQFLEESQAPHADLIIGDWNLTRGSWSMRRVFPDARHAFDEAGVGLGASFPERWAFLHIDHMLLRGSVRCTHYALKRAPVGRHRIQLGRFIRPAAPAATPTDG